MGEAKKPHKRPLPFSKQLNDWLKADGDTTLAGLNSVFAEKSFAVAFLVLMALAALPLPTGGVTHVTEIITMLVSLQLIVGRKRVWLPKSWQKRDISKLLAGKGISKLISVVARLEKFSRHRWSWLLTKQATLSALGVAVFLLTLAAFVAPPFSGLDTLPALGVVTISLAIILEDMALAVAGIVIGIAGVGLEIAAGTAVYEGLLHLI